MEILFVIMEHAMKKWWDLELEIGTLDEFLQRQFDFTRFFSELEATW